MAAPNERWNYWTVALYLSCYRVGLVLVQPDTVLPICLLELTDNPLLLGASSSLYLFFWTFPQSLIAFYTTRLREMKPLVSLLMVLHALPWAILAVHLVLSKGTAGTTLSPTTTIIAIYATVIAFSVLGGASIPGYMTMIGKTLMPTTRIRLLGYVWSTSVLFTFGASILMKRLIANVEFPLNFAVIFLLAFATFCMAITFWAETKEPVPPSRPARHATIASYYVSLWHTIRRERRFRRFLISIMLAGFALPLLMPFMAIHAVSTLGYSNDSIADFLLVVMTMQSVAGYITGRFLSKRTAVLGLFVCMMLTVTLGTILLVWHHTASIWVGYVLAGLAQGFFVSCFQTAMFEVTGGQDPGVVIGITNTFRAPFYALGPLVGGALYKFEGFGAVAGTCLTFALLACLAMYPVVDPAAETTDSMAVDKMPVTP